MHEFKRGALAEVRESSEVKSPTEKAFIVLPKDNRFMIQIKEKVASITNILKEFDVVHYCRMRVLAEMPVYERSPNFQLEFEEEN